MVSFEYMNQQLVWAGFAVRLHFGTLALKSLELTKSKTKHMNNISKGNAFVFGSAFQFRKGQETGSRKVPKA